MLQGFQYQKWIGDFERFYFTASVLTQILFQPQSTGICQEICERNLQMPEDQVETH